MAASGGSGWRGLVGGDPVPWILASDDPAARWLALTELLDRPPDHPDVVAAHAAVVADPRTAELIARLPDWEALNIVSGHNSPAFAPNLLLLLADMGIRRGDSPRVDVTTDALLRHRDGADRFASLGTSRANPTAGWGALLCDTHAITEVLVRFGRAADPSVRAAVRRMLGDLSVTAAGPAWPCIPSLGFRGPGRKGEPCPQVTVEALRVLAGLPDLSPADRAAAAGAARTLLAIWRRRGEQKPYMFGHGYAFKSVKWPPFWYSVLGVVDAAGRYPEVWLGADTSADDTRSLAELAACLIAYNVDACGRVTPRSCYRGFESFSFGQKKAPSPFATALVAVALRRVETLAPEIEAVDVLALASSKGGTGTARPPAGWPMGPPWATAAGRGSVRE